MGHEDVVQGEWLRKMGLLFNPPLPKPVDFFAAQFLQLSFLAAYLMGPLEMKEIFSYNANQLFNPSSTISLFIWDARLGKGSFQMEALTLIQNITENRIRHARGPVILHRVCYIFSPPSNSRKCSYSEKSPGGIQTRDPDNDLISEN